MRRSAPQGRSIGFTCLLFLQAALVACGEAGEPVGDPASPGPVAQRENEPPEIRRVAFEPESPVPGGAVRVVVDVHDPDGDPVRMSYEWSLGDRAVGNGTAKLMLRDAKRGDALRVVVVASDGRADSEPESVSVWLANQPPTVERLRVAPSTEVTAGEVIEAFAEGRDPEGDALEFAYTWLRNGQEIDGVQGPELDTRDMERGDVVRVEARASDGTDQSEPFRSPEIRITNRPPKVVSHSSGASSASGFTYKVVAEDPDGDAPLRFELESAPEGMQIGAHSGEIRWVPRAGQEGRHTIRVVVDDLRGGRIAHDFEVEVGGVGAGPAAVAR